MVDIADRVGRPGRVAIDAMAASWTITSEEDGCALDRIGCRESLFDLRTLVMRPGVRRASFAKVEPDADLAPLN